MCISRSNCSSGNDLGRIASANCGAVWSQSFGFDPFGNITKNGALSFSGLYSASTSRLTNMSAGYDNDGNLTAISSDEMVGRNQRLQRHQLQLVLLHFRCT